MDTDNVNTSNQQMGRAGENQARAFLVDKGYRWLASNFRTRWGEIDLVMKDADTIVFVEVKNRQNTRYGQPAEAVQHWKVKHLVKASLIFVMRNGWLDHAIRYDIVSITNGRIQHIPNAFQAGGEYYY